MSINKDIKKLVAYAIDHDLIKHLDHDYAINKICTILKINDYSDNLITYERKDEPTLFLKPLLDYAASKGIIEIDTLVNRDLLEAAIMDVFTFHPSVINNNFYRYYNESPIKATNYFYRLSKSLNYIKTSRTNKNIIFKSLTEYGYMDININLSKPEKDPRDIIASAKVKSTGYPSCLLCKENVGFYGNTTHPARTNHRIIEVKLNDEDFYLQYSPYVYYNEHSIVLKKEHEPMNVSIKTFNRLFDFVEQFPHYFLGSNAGLPIVGGSILSHEHYQGGNYKFPIEDALVTSEYKIGEVKIEKLYWPINVLRFSSTNRKEVVNRALSFYKFFESYSDEAVQLYSKTDKPHNAITPIARYKDGTYILDIALRNNYTNDDYPLGYFHPHQENHHIKKENIGLIEVLGLAVLPARLKDELIEVKKALVNNTILSGIHHDWVEELRKIYVSQPIDKFIEEQVAIKFVKCLEDACIFKNTSIGNKHYETFINEYIKTTQN